MSLNTIYDIYTRIMGNLLGSEPLTPTVSEDEWVEESVDTSDSKMEESLEEFVCRLESLEYNMFCSPNISTDALETKTVDSVGVSSNNLFANLENVTLDKVLAVEDRLDLDEKISLVYLLFEDAVDARDQLKDLLLKPVQTLKPIYEWAQVRDEIGLEWRKLFIEALAIIQDYHILRTTFGYSKIAVNDYYLPLNKYIATSVNRTRKMLYLIFDNLPSAKIREIFVRIQKELAAQRKTFRIPTKNQDFYFELYLLDLERFNFITSSNAQNLARVFKQMGMFERESDLKQIVQENEMTHETQNFEIEKKMFIGVVETKKATNCKLEQDNTNETSLNNGDQSLPSIASVSNMGNCYDMNLSTPGIALIISIEFYYTELEEEYKDLLPSPDLQLQQREGTEADVKILKDTFRHLHFNDESIIVRENRTHIQILQEVKDAANKVTKDHSTFFVAILTHGENEVIYGANSCRVEIKDIQKLMGTTNIANLEGKPKILLLQSCQGRNCQIIGGEDEDCAVDGPEPATKGCLPKFVDHFTFLATVPGYGAIRHKVKGTWFIQTFCKILQQNSDSQDFEDMCTETVGKVSSMIWDKNGKKRCMVPLKWSTLRKKLFFPPKMLKESA